MCVFVYLLCQGLFGPSLAACHLTNARFGVWPSVSHLAAKRLRKWIVSTKRALEIETTCLVGRLYGSTMIYMIYD